MIENPEDMYSSKFGEFWYKILWIRKAVVHVIGSLLYTYIILLLLTSPLGVEITSTQDIIGNSELAFRQLFPVGALIWLAVRVSGCFNGEGFNLRKL